MSEDIMDLLGDGADKVIIANPDGGTTTITSEPDEQTNQEEAALDTKPEDVTPPVQPAPKTVKGITGRDVKVSTRPWTSTENQWERDIFRIKPRTGWRPRFVDKGNVSRRRDEGWQVAKAADYNITNEEGQLDTSVVRRGMILMEMKEEMAESREDYFSRKTDLQTAQPDTVLKKALGKTQGELGGSVDMRRVDGNR